MSAPKQLAKRRKLERKQLRKRETRLKRQKERQKGWDGPGWLDPVAAFDPPFERTKMSEVLQDFVAPLWDSACDREACEHILMLGIVAWDAALQPQRGREAMINDMIEKGMSAASPSERQACSDTVHWLVARKLKLFAAYQRPIFSFQLDELEDGGYHLSVVSGLVC